jgi:transcriptional regulator with XRE-family HTH domain
MDGMDLKIARIRAHLTLWELGKLAGVHPARISEMERGQRPITDVVLDALSLKMSGAGREPSE